MKKAILIISLFSFSIWTNAIVSKTINLIAAGTLKTALTATELNTITNITITGVIDASDFKTMRDGMPVLTDIDLSGTTVASYSGSQGTETTTYNVYAANAIPAYAFSSSTTINSGKWGFKSFSYPSGITAIRNAAFWGCFNLKGVLYIPETVTYIGSNAFRWCYGFTGTLTIPQSVTYIGNYAFQDCYGLRGLIIPTSISSINMGTFRGCDNLTGILNIPSSITYIGSNAFTGCINLTSVIIPQSVTSIGIFAFNNCTRLTSIYANAVTPIDISSTPNVFTGVYTSSCKLYVPIGSKPLYETANQWKDFLNIIELNSTSLKTELSETIKLYPNPIYTNFQINGFNGLANILVRDFNGNIVLTNTISSQEPISLSGLPNSEYIIQITTELGTTEKIILKK